MFQAAPRHHREGDPHRNSRIQIDAVPLSTSIKTGRPQVLEEALMVLLILQGGLLGSIHTDLSRVPAFICTALVHILRSSILHRLDQVRSVLARQIPLL